MSDTTTTSTVTVPNSILLTVKKMLGIASTITDYDVDIVDHINSALFTLNQLGIGPTTTLVIEDEDDTWSQISTNTALQSIVKTYIYRRVRLAFDPPTSSYVLESLKQLINEDEWRLLVFSGT